MSIALVGIAVLLLAVACALTGYAVGLIQQASAPKPKKRRVAPVPVVALDDEDALAPEPTQVLSPSHGVVSVPPEVVAACIAEARGNHAVLERGLGAAADMLAMGMSPRDVLVVVQAGDQEMA